MTIKQKLAVKKSIEKSVLETQSQIDKLKDLVRPISPENAIARVSRMDAINNKSINEEVLRKSIKKLALLESALLRISEDIFGNCISCSKEISLQRILLLPQTNCCVECASR